MFLPSVWDCQPSQDDWDILKNPVHKHDPSASSTTPSITLTSTAAALSAAALSVAASSTVSVKQEVLVDVACNDIVDESLEFGNISQQNVRRRSTPLLGCHL